MRIGILGGTFDPVHYGHLLLAESCRDQIPLDRVVLVPAAVSPHKLDQQPTPATARVEMLQLAIAGHPQFEVSTVEIDRGGTSYSIDTLEALQQHAAEDEWFLLMGADTLRDFPKWHRPEDICRLTRLAVVHRPDAGAIDLTILEPFLTGTSCQQRPVIVSMPLMGISSSAIRQRVRQGQSIRYLLPRAVEKYIEEHGLYRA
jgi:nicotinate-nucleotide adenylyltransferase